jgi:CubicO group peptidase (beta-lactamase class C family)
VNGSRTRRRPRWWPALLACVASAAHSAAAAAQAAFPSDAAVRAILEQRVASGGAAGILVGLLDAGGQARYFAAGSAGPGKLPLDRSSVFEIGSITKVFTGTLLAEMALGGEVSLDDPVQKHLPAGVSMPSRNGIAVTLGHLATQTSGLPRLPGNLRAVTVAQLYEFLSGHELRRDPGAEYEYSNLGVGLLGHVLALRAGVTYEALVRARILDPLGMTHTAVALTPWMLEHAVAGHNAQGDTVPYWDLPALAGAGALRSTAEDMLRFLEANVRPGNGRLAGAMRMAHPARAAAGSPTMRIGLNWHRLAAGGDTLIWHNGGTGGFRTFAGFRPATGTAVVVLTNTGGQGSDDIGFHLLNPALPLRASDRRESPNGK